MIRRIMLALLVGIIVWLLCQFFGGVLGAMEISWITAAGTFLKTFAGLISLVAAVWYYFAGGDLPVLRR